MNCPNCNANIEKRWSYCPSCGTPFREFGVSFDFGDLFREMDRMTKDMEKEFARLREQNVEVLDLSPFFQHMKRGGFTVRINQEGGKPPRVDIQTFGGVDRAQLENEVRKRMGAQPRAVPVPVGPSLAKGASHAKQIQRTETGKRFAQAKQTKEPPAEIRRMGGRLIVDVHLPGVSSDKDIDISELESSVEVKAIAGDTAYFKILTKPGNVSLLRSQFHDGKLHLEFA